MRGNFVYRRLGQKVSFIRKQLLISQDELSSRAAVDRSYVGRIEVGAANPSLKVLYKLAKSLKIKLSDLLKDV